MTGNTAPTTWYNYIYAYPDGYTKDGTDMTGIVFYGAVKIVPLDGQ